MARARERTAAMSPLSVILPTRNEVDSILPLIRALLGDVPAVAEVIVVDDGSTDGTAERVTEAAREDGRIRLLARSGCPSLCASVRQGVLAAKCSTVAWMDADGAMAAADLWRMVQALTPEVDLVVGSRFCAHGRIKGQRQPGWAGRLRACWQLRHSAESVPAALLSLGFNTVLLPAWLGLGVHDYTSGFLVGRRDLLLELPWEGDYGEYFVVLLVAALRQGWVVREVGYAIGVREHGLSKTAASWRGLWRRGGPYLRTAWRRGSHGTTNRVGAALARTGGTGGLRSLSWGLSRLADALHKLADFKDADS